MPPAQQICAHVMTQVVATVYPTNQMMVGTGRSYLVVTPSQDVVAQRHIENAQYVFANVDLIHMIQKQLFVCMLQLTNTAHKRGLDIKT